MSMKILDDEKRFQFTRLCKSDGVRPQERWRRGWFVLALAGFVALLPGCIVRYVVLSDPPDSDSLPYYAGRTAVVIYSPLLDSIRVDSLYLYKHHK